jgi:mannose-1-phosphate guanylyltransferase
MAQKTEQDRLWAIVLSGGEGERVRPLIQRWLGQHKPKQYCTFVGTRSMFQHTLDRATRLVHPQRTATVVAKGHRREVWSQLDGRAAGTVLFQPRNRDTAAGVFLPLTYVRAQDPSATVVIFPSDHFVFPEDRFLEAVRRAVWTAEWLGDRLVLLGAVPDSLEVDYGWIMPGSELARSSAGHPVKQVHRFVEKPRLSDADVMLASGGLWNTLVLATKLDTLWRQGWECFPDMMPLFERVTDAIGTPLEGQVLADAYRDMPANNFSSGLLQRLPEQMAVMELAGVLWSDWGRPARITNTLRRIAKQPAFPLECLESPFVPLTQSAAWSGNTI